MRLFAIIMALFLSTSVSAEELKSALIQDLVEAQKLNEIWSEQLALGEEAGRQQAQQILDQLMSRINPNAEFRQRFSDSINKFMSAVQSPWTADELTSLFASYYGPKFSEEELRDLASFYRSELGQKEIEVARSAMVEFFGALQSKNQPIFEAAMNTYMDELRLIVKECNCAK